MVLKIVGVILLVVVLFSVYVSTRPKKFHYEMQGDIKAPVSKVFPYLSDLKLGSHWSPFERIDPNMKKDYQGTSNQVGAKLIFAGNKEAGAGSVEITSIEPLKRVDLKLTMTEPMSAKNDIVYRVEEKTPNTTTLTWSMSGNNSFFGKLINIFIDCEAMMKKQMQKGYNNLNEVIKNQESL